jgi:predicted nucleotidyltransferase
MNGNILEMVLGLSKVRQDILLEFFNNPQKSSHVSEIARETRHTIPTVSRELSKLEKANIFTSKMVGRSKVYSLSDSRILPPLKQLFFQTKGIEGLLKNILNKHLDIEFAFIFGSYASNTTSPTSDIDLLVVGDMDSSILDGQLHDLSDFLKRDIHLVLLSSAEFKENKKSDIFLKNVLEGNTISLTSKTENYELEI